MLLRRDKVKIRTKAKEKAKEKAKVKIRKNRKISKFGQVKLKHSQKGIKSCLIALGVLIVLLLLLAAAFVHKGKASAFIGAVGLMTLIGSWIGLIIGMKGFKERERNYITCKVGMGLNAFFILGFTAIFFRGFW